MIKKTKLFGMALSAILACTGIVSCNNDDDIAEKPAKIRSWENQSIHIFNCQLTCIETGAEMIFFPASVFLLSTIYPFVIIRSKPYFTLIIYPKTGYFQGKIKSSAENGQRLLAGGWRRRQEPGEMGGRLPGNRPKGKQKSFWRLTP